MKTLSFGDKYFIFSAHLSLKLLLSEPMIYAIRFQIFFYFHIFVMRLIEYKNIFHQNIYSWNRRPECSCDKTVRRLSRIFSYDLVFGN